MRLDIDPTTGEQVLLPLTGAEEAQRARDIAAFAVIRLAEQNERIKAQLADNDLRAIRALLENDTTRIEQYRVEQESLRLQLVPE